MGGVGRREEARHRDAQQAAADERGGQHDEQRASQPEAPLQMAPEGGQRPGRGAHRAERRIAVQPESLGELHAPGREVGREAHGRLRRLERRSGLQRSRRARGRRGSRSPRSRATRRVCRTRSSRETAGANQARSISPANSRAGWSKEAAAQKTRGQRLPGSRQQADSGAASPRPAACGLPPARPVQRPCAASSGAALAGSGRQGRQTAAPRAAGERSAGPQQA